MGVRDLSHSLCLFRFSGRFFAGALFERDDGTDCVEDRRNVRGAEKAMPGGTHGYGRRKGSDGYTM